MPRFIERAGARLAVHDAGGPGLPVVFQHGLCGDARQTAEAFPPDPAFRLITLECRGHGASGAGGELSIAQFTEDLAALIETLPGPVVAGGISMGAAITSRLAVTRPDLVRGLCLIRPAWVVEAAPANMQPNAEVGRLLATLPAAAARAAFADGPTALALARDAPDNLASLMGFFDRAPLAVTAALLRAISADGPGVTEDALRALSVPSLVCGTGADAIHPMAHAARLAALIRGARLVELPPKGADKPAHLTALRAALADFLAGFPREFLRCRSRRQCTIAAGRAVVARSPITSPSASAVTRTTAPSITSPASSFSASWSCSAFWITRFSGRAP